MLWKLFVASLLLISLVPATATASVDLCDKYGICPIVYVGTDRVCGGLGLGTQGIAACAVHSGAGAPCVRWTIGFEQGGTCDLLP